MKATVFGVFEDLKFKISAKILVRAFWKGKCTKRPISTFGCTFSAFFGFWVSFLWSFLGNYEKKVVLGQGKTSLCWEFHQKRLKIEETAAKCANGPFYAFAQNRRKNTKILIDSTKKYSFWKFFIPLCFCTERNIFLH